MQGSEQSPPNRKLLYFDQRSTTRLLEVYVKRSLSFNDAGGAWKQRLQSRKWVTPSEGGCQARRASSDSSTYRLSIERALRSQKPTRLPESKGTRSPSKVCSKCLQRSARKRPETKQKFLLRVFTRWFSRRNSEEKAQEAPPTGESGCSDCNLPEAQSVPDGAAHTSRGGKKKHSSRSFSFRYWDTEKPETLKRPLNSGDVVRLPEAVSVEPTNTYFEKVSEELERIVEEVENSPPGDDDGRDHAAAAAVPEDHSPAPDVDTIERIITLLKQQGDVIDEKIQKNSHISSFFQELSYGSFQQLADCYVSQVCRPAERVTHAAPELIQLAFTLDFTAKVAGLSHQAVSRIMGFGNQYLQDRFTQICSIHSQEVDDVEGQCISDPE